MSDDLSTLLQQFDGAAKLFPLPNVVLFPAVMLPLHIFEPRYRQMTADALAGDRLLAMTLLQAGWETDYEGRPPLHAIACLGRIVAEQTLDDGRYNLILRGLQRIRLLEETLDDKPYRSAQVELLHDVNCLGSGAAHELQNRIIRAARSWLPAQGPAAEPFKKLLQGDLPLGALCDVLGFALPFATEIKQQLLEHLDVEQRGRLLLQTLECQEPPKAKSDVPVKFPPDFSAN